MSISVYLVTFKYLGNRLVNDELLISVYGGGRYNVEDRRSGEALDNGKRSKSDSKVLITLSSSNEVSGCRKAHDEVNSEVFKLFSVLMLEFSASCIL